MISEISKNEVIIRDTPELSVEDITALFDKQVKLEQSMGWIMNLGKKYPGAIVNPAGPNGKMISLNGN